MYKWIVQVDKIVEIEIPKKSLRIAVKEIHLNAEEHLYNRPHPSRLLNDICVYI